MKWEKTIKIRKKTSGRNVAESGGDFQNIKAHIATHIIIKIKNTNDTNNIIESVLHTINIDGVIMTQSGPDWGGDWAQAQILASNITTNNNIEEYVNNRPTNSRRTHCA